MFIVGITGGIGSGKTTVSKYLEDKGLAVLDADKISGEVTAAGGSAVEEVAEVFGPKAVDADGAMNRKYISDIVFNDRMKLDLLSSIVHKHVFEEMDKRIAEETEKNTKCIVLDVPIPVRKFTEMADQVWVVTCDTDIRIRRLIDRGLSLEEAQRRIAMQLTDDEYADLGDYKIDNSGTQEETYAQIDELIKSQLVERGIRI
ncbi:MAG: dephospho-CoA kinase [Clostridiales bacterium]|nr:dephospho-CoA kinase [Clostridiales bacterium]